MRGRLVVCFDGTWNTAEDQTNVSRLYAAIGDRDAGCRGQLKFYDEGVGTVDRAQITDVRVGTHGDYDRVVIEFDEGIPDARLVPGSHRDEGRHIRRIAAHQIIADGEGRVRARQRPAA